MKQWPSNTVQVTIPSQLGYEKIAVLMAGEMARNTGLDADRVMDLCTAVGEACINAIEHGNRGLSGAAVVVTVAYNPGGITVEVQDCGQEQLPGNMGTESPSLEERIEGSASKRGWGLYLIRQLVDILEFVQKPGHNIVRLTVRYSSK